ncbi:MAG: pilus assembly protein TadG-related protein [Actinomycetota bacterium]
MSALRPTARRVRRLAVAARRDERGGTLPFLVILLPAFVGLAGLVHDGGNLFAARRHALDMASAAARAGANDLDEASIYAGDPELAPSAEITAALFANRQGATSATAEAHGTDLIEVTVTVDVDLLLLDAFGLGRQTVTAMADARVREGRR